MSALSRRTLSPRSFWSAAAAAAALCAPLVGCSDSLSGGASANSGFSLLLTDAPGSVKSAVVTVSRIYLTGGANGAADVDLMTTPVTVDLTTLANATSQLVQNATVPPGKYAELRFVITGGYVAVDNGSGGTDIYASSTNYAGLPAGAHVTGSLQMPSLAQSGLKVTLPDDSIATTVGHTLIVDFDVSQSFGHQAGNSGQWVMHPVLKATEFAESSTITATLQVQAGASVTFPIIGTDTTSLSSFNAILSNGSGMQKTVAFTDSAHTGVYTATFRYLAPDSYTLDVADTLGVVVTTTPSHPVTIPLVSGKDTTEAFSVTALQVTP